MATILRADKVTAREVKLFYREDYAVWPGAAGRFRILVVSSGTNYYSSSLIIVFFYINLIF